MVETTTTPTTPPPQPTWVIMPWLNSVDMTWTAVCDALAQTVPTRVLLVGQAVSHEDRDRMDGYIDSLGTYSPEDGPGDVVPRVLAWHYLPALPSLSAVWNRALDFVWELDGQEALVVNNDVRLNPETVFGLSDARRKHDALFVSAVGVRQEQYKGEPLERDLPWSAKGGPDFSCFLISAACHAAYRFDEGFIPAYCEDLDYHRRLMLAGDGHRIFSVNLPFLHFASGTLKAMDPEAQRKLAQTLGQSRAYYERKWGGPVNQETYRAAFNVSAAKAEGFAACLPETMITTPALQEWYRTHPDPIPDPAV